jgi:cephalosporin hydroxylase
VKDDHYIEVVSQWKELAVRHNYGNSFLWLGRKICQIPEDIVAFQELVWTVKPDLIIETGVADGGSILLSASLLALLNTINPSNREVIGIDINLGLSTRYALSTHPLSKYITLIEGDSTNVYTVDKVRERATQYKKILVCLDSDHSHNHVLKELENYAPFVSKGSYCIVYDTSVEDMPDEFFEDTTCRRGNSPRTAVNEFLKTHPEFMIDGAFENKLVFTCAKGGWLKRL